MARRNKNKVILEDVELKSQVIGYTYQKKSNLGRVIFLFVVFILVVFYINDISIFINDLIGKESSKSIKEQASNNNDKDDKKPEKTKEVSYNVFDNSLSIKEQGVILDNFVKENNSLKFDITNNGSSNINYSEKKFFIETYTENKTLVDRVKIDIKSLASGEKVNNNIEISNDFYYIVFIEKDINDYPGTTIESDEAGSATLTCVKGTDTIIYTFKNFKLQKIEHTIVNNNINSSDYYNKYYEYQAKVNNYNTLDGVTTKFNGTLNGFNANIILNLAEVNLSSIDGKYYYAYNEEAKVVSFEMQTYGFDCK